MISQGSSKMLSLLVLVGLCSVDPQEEEEEEKPPKFESSKASRVNAPGAESVIVPVVVVVSRSLIKVLNSLDLPFILSSSFVNILAKFP